MTIRLIAHLGPNGELGYQGKTIYQNPLDLQLFKLLTCIDGNVVIAGRTTAQSMARVSSNGRQLKYVSNTTTERLGKWKQWEHIDDLELFLNSDKTHIEEQVYIIGGAQLFQKTQQYAEEAIIMHDDTFSYFPCDTYWNPSKYFCKDELLFKSGSLECRRWRKRECMY